MLKYREEEEEEIKGGIIIGNNGRAFTKEKSDTKGPRRVIPAYKKKCQNKQQKHAEKHAEEKIYIIAKNKLFLF